MSNKPTHYLLDCDDFSYLLIHLKKMLVIPDIQLTRVHKTINCTITYNNKCKQYNTGTKRDKITSLRVLTSVREINVTLIANSNAILQCN